MISQKTTKIFEQVAQEYNYSPQEIKTLWVEYWKFIKNHLQSLPLKNNLSEEDFNNLRVNINIPSLGHFTCSYDRIQNIKKKNERYSNKED